LPTRKAGDFTIFGFGGLSSQDFYLEKDPSKWETEGDRYGGNFKANTGAIGLTHSISLGSSTHLKSSLATSYTDNAEQQDYLQDDGSMLNTYHNSYATRKWIFSS